MLIYRAAMVLDISLEVGHALGLPIPAPIGGSTQGQLGIILGTAFLMSEILWIMKSGAESFVQSASKLIKWIRGAIRTLWRAFTN